MFAKYSRKSLLLMLVVGSLASSVAASGSGPNIPFVQPKPGILFDSDQGNTKTYDSKGNESVKLGPYEYTHQVYSVTAGILLASGNNMAVTHERTPYSRNIDIYERIRAKYKNDPDWADYFNNLSSLSYDEAFRREEIIRSETEAEYKKQFSHAAGTFTFAMTENPKFKSVTATKYMVGHDVYLDEAGFNAQDKKITNVGAGEVSETSQDAINGSQLYATNQIINTFDSRIDRLGTEINKVAASAAALTGLHPVDFDPDNKLNFAYAGGVYRNQQSSAMGAFYRPNEEAMFHVGTTIGENNNMVNVGATFKLGQNLGDRKVKSTYQTAPISTVYVLEKELTEAETRLTELEGRNTQIKEKIYAVMRKLGV